VSAPDNPPIDEDQPATPLGDLRFNRLLVALDGSGNADLALAAAVTAARRDHSSLTLLVVVPDMVAESRRWAAGAPNAHALQEDVDDEAGRRLRRAIARIPEDIPVTTVVRRGKPGPQIVAVAREREYDAILMGARGAGRVAALIGSVSNYVMHHAPTAVFVAHQPPG
jgi:nucleotide-binding universal stress UspA family protein